MSVNLGNLNLYTIEDLKKKLGVTPLTLRRYFRDEIIIGRKMAGKWYVTEENLRAFFSAKKSENKPHRKT